MELEKSYVWNEKEVVMLGKLKVNEEEKKCIINCGYKGEFVVDLIEKREERKRKKLLGLYLIKEEVAGKGFVEVEIKNHRIVKIESVKEKSIEFKLKEYEEYGGIAGIGEITEEGRKKLEIEREVGVGRVLYTKKYTGKFLKIWNLKYLMPKSQTYRMFKWWKPQKEVKFFLRLGYMGIMVCKEMGGMTEARKKITGIKEEKVLNYLYKTILLMRYEIMRYRVEQYKIGKRWQKYELLLGIVYYSLKKHTENISKRVGKEELMRAIEKESEWIMGHNYSKMVRMTEKIEVEGNKGRIQYKEFLIKIIREYYKYLKWSNNVVEYKLESGRMFKVRFVDKRARKTYQDIGGRKGVKVLKEAGGVLNWYGRFNGKRYRGNYRRYIEDRLKRLRMKKRKKMRKMVESGRRYGEKRVEKRVEKRERVERGVKNKPRKGGYLIRK